MIPTITPAADLQVGDRTSISGKSRIARVHRIGERVYVKITTRGTRSGTVARYLADETVKVYRMEK